MILSYRWFHIIALNVHVPTNVETDAKDSSYEELERVFNKEWCLLACYAVWLL
jgi:hypothetical protein